MSTAVSELKKANEAWAKARSRREAATSPETRSIPTTDGADIQTTDVHRLICPPASHGAVPATASSTTTRTSGPPRMKTANPVEAESLQCRTDGSQLLEQSEDFIPTEGLCAMAGLSRPPEITLEWFGSNESVGLTVHGAWKLESVQSSVKEGWVRMFMVHSANNMPRRLATTRRNWSSALSLLMADAPPGGLSLVKRLDPDFQQ